MRGDEVELVFTKQDGSTHWHVPARWLGTDAHGTWLHSPVGTVTWRPGARVVHEVASVVCVPDGEHWVATFYDVRTPGAMQVYVDVATPAAWSDGEVSAVDLDLDVVLPHGGPPYVDDEDEFADHQVRYGYPPDLVTAARAACTAVLAAVTAARAPFDAATAQRWLERADPSWSPVVSRTPPEDQPR